MGIIRMYRSSATHWCKFGVHTLCCSQDRAVFLLQLGKTALLEMEFSKCLFSRRTSMAEMPLPLAHFFQFFFVRENRENSSIMGTTQHMNTKLAPMCYWGPVDSYDPHIIGLLYIGDVKANKRQNSLFCQQGKTLVKICPCPSVTKVVMVTKIRYGTEGS